MENMSGLQIILSNLSVNTTEDDSNLSDIGYTIIGGYLIAIGTSALLANILVVIVLIKGNLNYQDIHQKLLLNVVISDLCLAVFIVPLSTIASFYKGWIFGDVVCTVSGYFTFILCLNDMNTHAAIAVHRYLVVCKPQFDFYLRRRRAVLYFFVPMWCHTLFFSILPFSGWNGYTTEAFGLACSIDWTADAPTEIFFIAFTILGCFFLHVAIFVFCYGSIVKTFSKAAHIIERLRGEILADAHTVKLEAMLHHHKTLTHRKVTFASVAMVSAFLIAWSPYALLSFRSMFTKSQSTWIRVIPSMFAKSCIVLSPLSCALSSCSFRKAARELYCGEKRDEADIPEMMGLQETCQQKM